MSKKCPLFITFEGGEGAGKSSIMARLHKKLEQLGYLVVQTREPGGTVLGEHVRNLLLHKKECSISPISEILLFLTSRAQQIQEIIQPHLKQNYIVLCDRYNDSTVAYQGLARGVGQKATEELCTLACQHLTPDMTFVLDLDPKIGLKRAQKMNKDWDRMESQAFSFYEKVQSAYQQLARENPERITLISADQPIDAVFQACWEVVEKKLSKNSKRSVGQHPGA